MKPQQQQPNQTTKSEKRTKSARKKKRRTSDVIRLSNDVLASLRVKKRRGESWDGVLRRLLGLPDRKGKEQTLRRVWVLLSTGQAFDNLPEANGEAVLQAVRKNKKKTEAPVPFLEIPKGGKS